MSELFSSKLYATGYTRSARSLGVVNRSERAHSTQYSVFDVILSYVGGRRDVRRWRIFAAMDLLAIMITVGHGCGIMRSVAGTRFDDRKLKYGAGVAR